MVGWKRIVVTVGEKIGKAHLTYGQGASAELIAAATIIAADQFGLPVSTTHVLSSGIAGTMAANGSGLAVEHCAQYRPGVGFDTCLPQRCSQARCFSRCASSSDRNGCGSPVRHAPSGGA